MDIDIELSETTLDSELGRFLRMALRNVGKTFVINK